MIYGTLTVLASAGEIDKSSTDKISRSALISYGSDGNE